MVHVYKIAGGFCRCCFVETNVSPGEMYERHCVANKCLQEIVDSLRRPATPKRRPLRHSLVRRDGRLKVVSPLHGVDANAARFRR